MTWQPVDENTYIDNTLVTCAEYQLFIDEMREQGKYFQPDHWTFTRFPLGQAREPILGIRYPDAKAFCEWISNQKGKSWLFRLPTTYEADNFPIQPYLTRKLGYWLAEYEQFKWIGDVPTNARAFDLEKAISTTRSPHRGISQTILLDTTIEHAVERSASRALSSKIDRTSHIPAVQIRTLISLSNMILNRIIEADNNLRPFNTDLYIDLYTLQERIAGRSPAFEGIRLVKERIK